MLNGFGKMRSPGYDAWMGQYYRQVLACAWSAYLAYLKGGARQVIGFLIQTALVLGILYYMPWFGNLQEESRLVAAGVGAVVASGLLTFVWEIIRAPCSIDEDRKAKIGSLENDLTVLSDVRAVREEGQKLIERGEIMLTHLVGEEQRKEMNAWEDEAGKYLTAHFHPTIAYQFRSGLLLDIRRAEEGTTTYLDLRKSQIIKFMEILRDHQTIAETYQLRA